MNDASLTRRYLALHLPWLPSERLRRKGRIAGPGCAAPPEAPSKTPPEAPSKTPHGAPSKTPPEAPSKTPPEAPPKTPPETPFALVAKQRGAMIVVAVDMLAAEAGIAPGLALADARARLPGLAAIEHDPAGDARLLDWLADGADRYTPMVMAVPPAGLVLDITGCCHGFRGEAGLADDIARRLVRLGLTVQMALADTPDAACALAAHELAAVEDLPVTALAVAEAVHLALRRAGLNTVGDLARQSRAALAARFGEGLVLLLARLLGEIDAHIVPRRLPAEIETEQRFATPLAQSDAALAVIEALAVKAGLRLAERDLGGRRFDVALFRSDGHVARLSVETGAPVRDAAALIRLLREKIGALADPLDPGFGYDLIRLAVPVTAPLAARQLLLAGGDLADGEIDALVDRLGARLGRGRVRRLVAADSHVPEQAAFDLPLAAVAGDAAREMLAWPQPAPGEPPARPIKLFDPPQPIEVIAEVPDGPPRRFRWRRKLHEVAAHEGPERIAAEWWRRADGAGLTRDYYRVEDGEGRRFWLFRHGLYGAEKAQPGWYLHGLFA